MPAWGATIQLTQVTLPTLALACAALSSLASAQTLPPPPVSPTPVTQYEYDAQGNRTKIIRGAGTLNLETKLSYDPLSRVKEHTDPKNGKTGFEYDGRDRTTQVTDPRSLVTRYPRDGFGNATQLVSPDTGTANHTFDEEGNLLTRLDSRGVLETYTYDGLGRLTSLVYSKSGQASQTYSWSYDLKGADYSYSANRLSRTDHPSGASRFKYDPQGRVVEAVQAVYAATGANSSTIVSTTRYGYTLGRLTSITYPSGRKLVLGYTDGELTSLSLAPDINGTAAPLLTDIRWGPFGPASSWNWAMASGAVAHERFYDQSGRIVRLRLGDVFRDITYDAADRIVSYTHLSASDGIPQPSLDQSFGYDENDRITSITTVSSSWAISYDANGNRTGVTLNGSPSVYTTEATSNRLASITNPARSFGYDNAGNTTTDSPNYTATYGLSGSLASISRAGITGAYSYDADKRRIRKVTSEGAGSTIIFVYDQEGHLLGEYNQGGQAIREYVWLADTPVAMLLPDPVNVTGAPQVFYIHTDHLDTPRIMVDQLGHKRWRWLGEPFGTTAPETNPAGLGVFVQPLRLPGQYADDESGLFYNHHRHYDSLRGTYTQSDMIGLDGGVNTYAYTAGNPLTLADPSGLKTHMCVAPLHALTHKFGEEVSTKAMAVPTLYHQYLCVTDKAGVVTCGGQDQRGKEPTDALWGPGVPSQDSFNPERCEEKEPDNECIEKCLIDKFAGPRPTYGIPLGTDCQEWAHDTLNECRFTCAKYEPTDKPYIGYPNSGRRRKK